MTSLRIHEQQTLDWIRPADRMSAEDQAKLTAGERTVQIAIREPGTEDQAQLLEIAYEAGTRIKPHAHEEDEIIYVLDGELHLGTKLLKAGDSMFIPGRSFYSFTAGPQGLKILNFRPRKDATYYEHGSQRKSLL